MLYLILKNLSYSTQNRIDWRVFVVLDYQNSSFCTAPTAFPCLSSCSSTATSFPTPRATRHNTSAFLFLHPFTTISQAPCHLQNCSASAHASTPITAFNFSIAWRFTKCLPSSTPSSNAFLLLFPFSQRTAASPATSKTTFGKRKIVTMIK